MQYRPLWKVVVFGIITLGIYDLYWLYATRRDMVNLGQKIPRFRILFLPYLLFAAMFLVSLVSLAFRSSTENEGVSSVVNIIMILLGVAAIISFIPITLVWMYKYCQAVDNVTNRAITTGLSFGLFILFSIFSLFFVWPIILQDEYNKLSQPPASPAHPTPAQPGTTQAATHEPLPPADSSGLPPVKHL